MDGHQISPPPPPPFGGFLRGLPLAGNWYGFWPRFHDGQAPNGQFSTHECTRVVEYIVLLRVELLCYFLRDFLEAFSNLSTVHSLKSTHKHKWRRWDVKRENMFDCMETAFPVAEFEEFADDVGPQRPSQDFWEPETSFFRKIFKFIDEIQFEVHLQTKVVEVGCAALQKTTIIGTEILLFLLSILKNFKSDSCRLSEPDTGHVVVSHDEKD